MYIINVCALGKGNSKSIIIEASREIGMTIKIMSGPGLLSNQIE